MFQTTQAKRRQGKQAERSGLTSANGVGSFLMLNWPIENARLFHRFLLSFFLLRF